jgi:UPF0176 protein
MSNPLLFFVLAYYHFESIENPHQFIAEHKAFLKNRNMTCRIYISEKGINGQASGIREDAEAYMQWIHANPLFQNMPFKIHTHHENVFPRQVVKYRKQIVALDEEVDLKLTGEHLSPEAWKEMLEKKEDKILIDVRNEYEWVVGRFEGAECPPCDTFREFKEYVHTLENQLESKDTPVMMYCTGGIRCELYSALLRKEGFKNVYQLDGGVINYGLKQGTDHWLGKLFVFDDRLTVPIADEATPVIGRCKHCDAPNETYYNCASMECNNLYLCCLECADKHLGCCSTECMGSPRIRPYRNDTAHKPFLKKHHYLKK